MFGTRDHAGSRINLPRGVTVLAGDNLVDGISPTQMNDFAPARRAINGRLFHGK